MIVGGQGKLGLKINHSLKQYIGNNDVQPKYLFSMID